MLLWMRTGAPAAAGRSTPQCQCDAGGAAPGGGRNCVYTLSSAVRVRRTLSPDTPFSQLLMNYI